MRNARSFSSAGSKLLRAGIICLMFCLTAASLTGCSWGKQVPADGIVQGTGPISAERIHARRASKSFICLIASTGKPYASRSQTSGEWEGVEPEIVRQAAQLLRLKPVFVELPADALSAALRNGRGDIAAGHLDTRLIESLYLSPVLPYASVKDSKLALMVRTDDIQWKQALEEAAKQIDTAKIVASMSNTLNSASVKLLPQDSGDDQPAISVSVEAKPVQKAQKK